MGHGRCRVRIHMSELAYLRMNIGLGLGLESGLGLGLVGTTFKQNEYKVQMLISQSILIRLL